MCPAFGNERIVVTATSADIAARKSSGSTPRVTFYPEAAVVLSRLGPLYTRLSDVGLRGAQSGVHGTGTYASTSANEVWLGKHLIVHDMAEVLRELETRPAVVIDVPALSRLPKGIPYSGLDPHQVSRAFGNAVVIYAGQYGRTYVKW